MNIYEHTSGLTGQKMTLVAPVVHDDAGGAYDGARLVNCNFL